MLLKISYWKTRKVVFIVALLYIINGLPPVKSHIIMPFLIVIRWYCLLMERIVIFIKWSTWSLTLLNIIYLFLFLQLCFINTWFLFANGFVTATISKRTDASCFLSGRPAKTCPPSFFRNLPPGPFFQVGSFFGIIFVSRVLII